jgi:hypothetical protein
VNYLKIKDLCDGRIKLWIVLYDSLSRGKRFAEYLEIKALKCFYSSLIIVLLDEKGGVKYPDRHGFCLSVEEYECRDEMIRSNDLSGSHSVISLGRSRQH